MQALLTTCEAARYCHLSPRTLEKYRVIGGGPTYVHLGEHAVRYRQEDLDIWIENNRRRTTSDLPRPDRAGNER
jgi:hypothetical protein